MLAGAKRPDRKFGVQRVGEDDVDDLDPRIVGDAVEVVIAVDAVLRHAILGGDAARLLAIAADQSGQARAARRGEGVDDLAERQLAEADDRETELAVLRQGFGGPELAAAGGPPPDWAGPMKSCAIAAAPVSNDAPAAPTNVLRVTDRGSSESVLRHGPGPPVQGP